MTTKPYKANEVEDAGEAACYCDGCSWTGPASEVGDIKDCALSPGDASPVGRCPDKDCESLCYLNKPLRDNEIEVDLNIFDDEGNQVDGTTGRMTRAQISNVIDHAAQLILIRRAAHRSSGDTDAIMAELEDALVASGVIDASDRAILGSKLMPIFNAHGQKS